MRRLIIWYTSHNKLLFFQSFEKFPQGYRCSCLNFINQFIDQGDGAWEYHWTGKMCWNVVQAAYTLQKLITSSQPCHSNGYFSLVHDDELCSSICFFLFFVLLFDFSLFLPIIMFYQLLCHGRGSYRIINLPIASKFTDLLMQHVVRLNGIVSP